MQTLRIVITLSHLRALRDALPETFQRKLFNVNNTVHSGHVHPHIWLQLVESFSNMGLPIYLRNSWQWTKRSVLATKQYFKVA